MSATRIAASLLAASLIAASLASAGGARAEPTLSILPLSFLVREFRAPDSRAAQVAPSAEAYRGRRELVGQPLVVLWGEGGGAALALVGPDLRIVPAGRGDPDLSGLEGAPGAIPSSRVAASGPLTASLVEPTRAYAHAALGSPTHARAVEIRERGAAPAGPEPRRVPVSTARIQAGEGAVFEDREPRLADFGQGPVVLVVRSTQAQGSSLAVIGRTGEGWGLLAETPPDGQPMRWLNPAGTFAVGRERLVALVRRPHLDGVLQLWRWTGQGLALAAEAPGYSDHANGQHQQGLAALWDGAGNAPLLAIPTLDRGAVAILALAPGTIREVARVPLPAKAATGLAVLGRGAAARILVGLEDGRVAEIKP